MHYLNQKKTNSLVKMNYLKTISLALTTLFSSISFSQDESHLLKYTDVNFQGSARFMGMGGSMGALGGDISSSGINPASLGGMTENYAGIGALDNFKFNSSTYNGVTELNSSNSFKVPSAGFVIAEDMSDKENGIMFQQITVQYSGIKSLHSNLNYNGQNFYSLLEPFAIHGQGIPPSDIYSQRAFTTAMAYEVFALDYNSSNETYVPRLNNGDMYHEREVRTRGGIGEGGIGYSINFSHTFYLGANLNFRFIRHKEEIRHKETLTDTSIVSLRSFEYDNNIHTKGFGGNLKLGAIYLVNNNIKLGIAYHSPSFMSMEDSVYSDMKATHDFGTQEVLDGFEPFYIYKYRHRTPQRMIGSVSYGTFDQKIGVNLDVEYSNYSKAIFKRALIDGDAYNFEDVNEAMSTTYAPVVNFRLGGEVKIVEDVFARAGYGLYPTPLRARASMFDNPRHFYSGGFGFKIDEFIIDLAYSYTQYSSEYYAFDPSKIENLVTTNTQSHSVVLTVSGRF